MRIAATCTRLGAGAVLVGLAGLGPALPVSADDVPPAGAYTVVARADTLRFQFVETGAPVAPGGEILDASPTTAQALLDSVGRSEGFAAAPTPGPFFATLGSNANGVLAGYSIPFGFPDYPFYAASSHPVSPTTQRIYGPFQMRADSQKYRSEGDARAGAVSNDEPAAVSSRARALTAVDPDDGTRTALAEARLDGLSAGPLRIGRSLAQARMTQTPGQAPAKASSFSLAEATIAGVAVEVTDQGLKVGGQAPATVDITALQSMLAQAGIAIEFLPPVETATSIDSAGLRIVQAGTDPSGSRHAVALLLGRVHTSIQADSTPMIGSEPTVVPEPPASQPAPPLTAALTDGVVADSADGATSELGISPLPAAGSNSITADTAVATPPAAGDSHGGDLQLAYPATVPVRGPDASRLYLVVVAAGFVIAGSRLVGRVGVQLLPWFPTGGGDPPLPSALRLPER